MKRRSRILITITIGTALACYGSGNANAARSNSGRGAGAGLAQSSLARRILSDKDLDTVKQYGAELIRSGSSAGNGYGVFIRDLNTFIAPATKIVDRREIKNQLVSFLRLQGSDGNIADEIEAMDAAQALARGYMTSAEAPGLAAKKGTAEVDQESSLVQAVYKYVTNTGDSAFLMQTVNQKTVLERMKLAMQYVADNKTDSRYHLIVGVTTIDWGDAQLDFPYPGGTVTAESHAAISIYSNAMYILAMKSLIPLLPPTERAPWQQMRARMIASVRETLWDNANQKFRTHVYTNGSPFPSSFDENAIEYHGGTAVAIEAGILSDDEIRAVNAQMVADARMAGAPSIGLSVFPPYPASLVKNYTLCPYCYQNGGSWPWFGGRMIRQLALHGMAEEAYTELRPMIAEVVRDKGFNEWYNLSDKGSGAWNYRGNAGVLTEAIDALQSWARAHVR